jgi:hypothetical protein
LIGCSGKEDVLFNATKDPEGKKGYTSGVVDAAFEDVLNTSMYMPGPASKAGGSELLDNLAEVLDGATEDVLATLRYATIVVSATVVVSA